MIHVEFLGIPGSGKTTLQNRSVPALNRAAYRAWDEEEAMYEGLRRQYGGYSAAILGVLPYYPFRKTLLRMLDQASGTRSRIFREFLVAHPDLASNILQSLDMEPTTARRNQLQTWFYRLITRFELASRALPADELVLFDEGFCSRAFSLYGVSDDETERERLHQYLEQMPKQDHIIVVETDPERCLSRLTAREQVPYWFQGQDQAESLRTLKEISEQIERICDTVAKRDISLHRISGAGGVASSVDAIVETLTSPMDHES